MLATGFSSRSNASVPKSEPDLRVHSDVRTWLANYRKADPAGQEALLKSWLVRERSYVEILRQCRPEDRAAAQEVLLDLWRGNRMSPLDRASLVRAVTTMRIVELEAWNDAHGRRELVLEVERRFPFPNGTWFEWSYDIDIGDRPLRINPNASGCRDWEGTGKLPLGSLGGGRHFGTPSARALIEVRELVGGKIVWRQTWSVGPTRLSFIAPPRPGG
jgi:hypothetical protein